MGKYQISYEHEIDQYMNYVIDVDEHYIDEVKSTMFIGCMNREATTTKTHKKDSQNSL